MERTRYSPSPTSGLRTSGGGVLRKGSGGRSSRSASRLRSKKKNNKTINVFTVKKGQLLLSNY